MADQHSLEDELKKLKSTTDALSKRIASLEQRLGTYRSAQSEYQPVQEAAPVEISASEEFRKETQAGNKGHFEEAVGFKWFGRIGILALVLGVAFFVKYAFDNNLIGYLARIIIGVIFGVGLIVGGEIVARKEKYLKWARNLVAGGIAITYFSTYAAYHFPVYREAIGISLSTDLILLSLVVIGAVILAIKDDSKIVAGEGFVLGYLTAFLGEKMDFTTLIYSLLLTLALITVTIYKQWAAIGIGGIIGTYLVYFKWSGSGSAYNLFSVPETFWIPAIFLSTYYLAYVLYSLLIKEKETIFGPIVAVVNSLIFFLLFGALVDYFFPDFTGLFSWILTVTSFIIYLLARLLKRTILRFTYLALAIFFLTVTIPIEFEGEWITFLWALEALLLAIVGVNANAVIVRYAAYCVAGITALKTLGIDYALSDFNFENLLDSKRVFVYLAVIISFYFTAFYLKKHATILEEQEIKLPDFYTWSSLVLLTQLIWLEMESFWISIGWASLALLIMVLGFGLKQKALRLQGILLFAITIVKVFVYDTSELSTLYRTVSFLVLGAILLSVSFVYAKYKDRLKDVF